MSNKIIIKYILKFIPFIFGLILFLHGNITLFSSLLLFCGGYVVLKNTLDYRILKKNIMNIKNSPYRCSFEKKSVAISKKRINCRVRKRTK